MILSYITEFVTEFSKYAIAICMALYTYECFAVFRFQGIHAEEERRGIYSRQKLLIFLVQLLCFLNLIVAKWDMKYLFFYGLVQVFLLTALSVTGIVYDHGSRLFANNMCMLLGLGLCLISRLSYQKAMKQYVIILASFMIAIFVPMIFNKWSTFWVKLPWVYAAVGLFFLSAVLILGQVTYGSKISYTIHGITFQPSELVKLLFALFLAAALWEDTSLKRVAVTTVLAAAHVLILVFSKDLGSALIFFVCYLFVLLSATKNYWYFAAGLLGGVLASIASYFLFDHVKVRVLAYLDPWSYIDKEGYQITQSLFAISNGGFFGTGLFQGNPTSIPFVDADFIFSAVCEELGVLVGICLVLICVSSFIMTMDICVRLQDGFYRLMAYGLGIMYLFQIFLTVGGGIKFIPLTGVTLPFVSYGGSSILTSMLMFYMLQAAHIRLQQEGEERIARKQKGRQAPPQTKHPGQTP